MAKAIEDGRGRALSGGQHSQHRASAALAMRAPYSAEDALAILPRDLEIAYSISVEPKGWVHSPNSAATPRSRFARVPLRLCR